KKIKVIHALYINEDLSVSVLLSILHEVCAFVRRRFNFHSMANVAFVPVDAIASCCLRVSKYIRREDLHSVSKYEIQQKSGVCEIDAVVLHIKKKRICADLRVLPRLKKLKKNHKPKRA
uniref:Chemokine interleukin-8-like domain-containing protein n=1 Tax=Cyprinus carpio TaxID=7962 RepID=A0A8C2EHD4_CYPCA